MYHHHPPDCVCFACRESRERERRKALREHSQWCACSICREEANRRSIRRHPNGGMSRNPSATIGEDATLDILAQIFKSEEE